MRAGQSALEPDEATIGVAQEENGLGQLVEKSDDLLDIFSVAKFESVGGGRALSAAQKIWGDEAKVGTDLVGQTFPLK